MKIRDTYKFYIFIYLFIFINIIKGMLSLKCVSTFMMSVMRSNY